jgi:group II intron reverse transcriptase/maturase
VNARKANNAKEKARQLQRALYLAAKEKPTRRFHALYDKICREDIMTYAWKQVKANKGSAGIDKITIQSIVEEGGEQKFIRETCGQLRNGTYRPTPVRRVDIPKGDGKTRPLGIPTVRDRLVQMAAKIVLESIFEADFKDFSYGFRPKRSAHDALQRIMTTVNYGKVYWVVDVDIKGYFDNISHEKLMTLVEQRVCDRKVLKLIQGWLTAGVMKDDQFHESDLGSPQGGVISPLLANIYLNYLDTIWERKFTHLGTMVRYADDLVVLCHRRAEAHEAVQVLKAVFARLELTMNTEKSKLVFIWKCDQGFDFLGHHLRRLPVMRKGGKEARILRCYPSKKAMKKMRAKVKEATASRSLLPMKINDLIKELNPKIRGWRNYYAKVDKGVANGFLAKIDWYIRKRLMIFCRKKYKRWRLKQSNFFEVLKNLGLRSATTWRSTYCAR